MAVDPAQMAVELGMAVITGSEFTVKLTVFVFTQLLASVPVTVYMPAVITG